MTNSANNFQPAAAAVAPRSCATKLGSVVVPREGPINYLSLDPKSGLAAPRTYQIRKPINTVGYYVRGLEENVPELFYLTRPPY